MLVVAVKELFLLVLLQGECTIRLFKELGRGNGYVSVTKVPGFFFLSNNDVPHLCFSQFFLHPDRSLYKTTFSASPGDSG